MIAQHGQCGDQHVTFRFGNAASLTSCQSAQKWLKNTPRKYAANVFQPSTHPRCRQSLALRHIHWNKQIFLQRGVHVIPCNKSDFFFLSAGKCMKLRLPKKIDTSISSRLPPSHSRLQALTSTCGPNPIITKTPPT